jgi:hypothetical protein
VQILKSKNDSYAREYQRPFDIEGVDFEYYRTAGAGVGKYIRKEDSFYIGS